MALIKVPENFNDIYNIAYINLMHLHIIIILIFLLILILLNFQQYRTYIHQISEYVCRIESSLYENERKLVTTILRNWRANEHTFIQ